MSCDTVRTSAAEFVLGTLDGVERAALIDHLDGCARCREEIAALADTVNDLALLAPEVEPSAGFAERVLARGSTGTAAVATLPGEQRRLELVEPQPVPPRPLRRRRAWVVLAAAAAIVALAIGFVSRREPDSSGSVAFAVMVTPDGGVMGTTSALDGGGVAVAVEYPTNWHDYRLEVVRRDGSTMTLGPMTLSDGAWRWQGQVPDSASVERLRVVRPDGRVTCWGRLPA